MTGSDSSVVDNGVLLHRSFERVRGSIAAHYANRIGGSALGSYDFLWFRNVLCTLFSY